MIKVVAKNFVKPQKIENFIALAEKLIAQTRKSDAGCIRYGLFQDTEDSGILTFIEEWEDKAALDKHMAAAHFKEIVPKLDEFCEKPGKMNLYRPAEPSATPQRNQK